LSPSARPRPRVRARATLSNYAVLDQGGASRRRWPGVSAALSLRRYARRTLGHTAQTRRADIAHPARKPMRATRTPSPGRYQLPADGTSSLDETLPEDYPGTLHSEAIRLA